MTSITDMHFDGPLDLRVRRDRPDDDRFVSKGSSNCTFQAGGDFVEETDKLRRMHGSILKIVKQENETDYDYSDETFGFRYSAKEGLYLPPRRLAEKTNGMHDTFFNFIEQENGRIDYKGKAVHFPFTAESEFYPDEAGSLGNITVKQEPETEESYFQPNGEKFPFANDYISKVEENSSDDDNLIIDVNFEEKSPSKKRLDRSDSNCSTNSNSSCTSDTGEDIRSFLRSFSSPYKVHKCTKCKVRFSDLNSLFEHLDGHVSRNPGEKFMKCPMCMRKFQKILGINAHIRKMHLGPMEFVCQFCQLSFKYNLHLQKHESTCRKKKKVENAEGNDIDA